ncbi:ABC transporter ATP-binding protein [Thalassobius vesicularis]|uniref:ABC transporter ATP-binding protein n=1 Tax=Thalassobius vesicularis TaxID=1294297 RepID=A0A4S3MCA8_9RHOB|nr:ABC transporter ATP-binding protein [Thalassobius vesicularis]THD75700.1 ABC transporter ATP-binding protein [Thalassobius vesicularis]
MSLLRVRNLQVNYGASQALFGVELDVAEGEVVALLGRNGMGKTTTIHALCRMIPSVGEVVFAGKNLLGMPSHRAANLGLGLVPEGRRCFGPLSVTENLVAAARPGDWDLSSVFNMFPRLKDRKTQLAGSLSGGEQQMLAIGRALMTNPRLLLLDEATEGLAPVVRNEIWAAIRSLKQNKGLSIILVDKSLREMASVADRAVILERGKSVWTGQMADLTEDRAARYLGV